MLRSRCLCIPSGVRAAIELGRQSTAIHIHNAKVPQSGAAAGMEQIDEP